MSVVSFKVNIQDLAELQKTASSEVLNAKIATGIGAIANALHRELELGVHQRYTLQQSIDSVLIGKEASITTNGNVISATLAYEYKSLDLSKFPYTPTSIPYPPGYAEHSVTIVRGHSRVVRCKSNNGGFVPRNKANKAWRARDGKTRMFERVGSKRLPLHVLYGPSLSQMTHNVLINNPTEGVNRILNTMDDLLATKLVL